MTTPRDAALHRVKLSQMETGSLFFCQLHYIKIFYLQSN